MFQSITYLLSGNEVQRKAWKSISKLGVMEDLKIFTPILCGTVPIGIDIEGSDLDIILEVQEKDFHRLEKKFLDFYQGCESFQLTKKTINEMPVLKANFFYEGFDFELFGQPKPVFQQNAYLHMVIEHALLRAYPELRENVRKLKMLGFKTEPAFAKILGLNGNPYDALLAYGRENGIIDYVSPLTSS